VIKPGTITTTSSPTRTCCPRCWPPRACRREGAAAQGHEGRRARPSRSTWTATTSPTRSPARRPTRARVLLLDDDGDAACLRYNSGRSCFWSSARRVSMFGRIPSCSCALPKIFSLRSDPFETGGHGRHGYKQWRLDRPFLTRSGRGDTSGCVWPVQGLSAALQGRQLQASIRCMERRCSDAGDQRDISRRLDRLPLGTGVPAARHRLA
jgi:hypothetical protein